MTVLSIPLVKLYIDTNSSSERTDLGPLPVVYHTSWPAALLIPLVGLNQRPLFTAIVKDFAETAADAVTSHTNDFVLLETTTSLVTIQPRSSTVRIATETLLKSFVSMSISKTTALCYLDVSYCFIIPKLPF